MKITKLVPAAIGLLMAGLVISAPVALADNDSDNAVTNAPAITGTAFTETATNSTFTQGTLTTNSAGDHLYRDSVYTGSLSGNLIATGTYRTDLNFFTAADASTSSVAGTFTFTDSSNTANTVKGFLRGTVDSSSNASGNFVISGGTGSFANAAGQGTFSGPLNNASNAGTTTFTGQWAVVPGEHEGFGTRPGNGFGDENHVHTGAPGTAGQDDEGLNGNDD